jgi:thymidylate synthase (FAD)
MKVRLITKTSGAEGTEYEGKTLEEIIVGIARISSSRDVNHLFDEPHKLIRYCISHGHWSIFSQANLGFEIITSRDMGRELLRHSSIKPQELSQRYAQIFDFEGIELRWESKRNRQSSEEICTSDKHNNKVKDLVKQIEITYADLIVDGIAKETARFILPGTTGTKLIMNGGVREWITMFNQRLHKTAQKEVRLVVEAICKAFIQECPLISLALFNFENAYDIPILDRVTLEKYHVYQSAWTIYSQCA